VRVEVLTAVKMLFFWILTPCGLRTQKNNAVLQNNYFQYRTITGDGNIVHIISIYVACHLPSEPKMTLLIAEEYFKSRHDVLCVF
jgi:hypothetical protein